MYGACKVCQNIQGVIRMPRVYITGDLHGHLDIHKLTAKQWPEGRELTKDDVLLVAGDFGLVFYPYKDDSEEYWLDWLEKAPWTTLFIDGNHENFDRLYKLPIEERYGGPVGVVRPSVLHLRQRGHVYTIADKRFWCFGGAESIDKKYRIEGRSWWPQEEPAREQMEYGLSQIEKCGGKFDYVVTHDCPMSVLMSYWEQFGVCNSADKLKMSLTGQYLEAAAENISPECKCWYFGHYHVDSPCRYEGRSGVINMRTLYRAIVRLV